jgi:hypothetical protein
MTNLPFEIEQCIACEDIREELHKKHSLIGVYSGDTILMSQIPGNIAIACFIQIAIKETGKHDLTLRLSGPGDHEATLKARLVFDEAPGHAVIATPRIDLTVDSEGIFKFDISADNENWVNLVTRKIALNPELASAPLPPSELSPPDALDSSSPLEPSPQGSPKKRRPI